jgi:hypothetical protein
MKGRACIGVLRLIALGEASASDVFIKQAFRVRSTCRFAAGGLPSAGVERCGPGAAPGGVSRMASVLSSDGMHG